MIMKRNRKKKIKAILPIFVLILMVISFIGGHFTAQNDTRKAQVKLESSTKASSSVIIGKAQQSIMVPTIYINGSGGDIRPSQHIIDGMFPNKATAPETGLTILVDISRNNKLTVSGKISSTDKNPIVQFATVKGTDDGELYSKALKVAMDYLVSTYHITKINMVGYSSGATGGLYYILDYGNESDAPKVQEFISLDGEYNKEKNLEAGETLQDVLTYGPILKTSMYQYIEDRYTKIDPNTKFYLMEGNWSLEKQTDEAIPWADTFSIYHLLVANKNNVNMYLYPTKLRHGLVPKDPLVANYIKNILYPTL
ncbi:hypothetical protein RT41_GL000388 [Lactococcus fujiensis JCM 16395]|uniref:Alpha/beta hydrolase n=2 Tax=Lactococcus fujiensis TaxID=610251 RepID=A0A2A5RQB9_9LACT|nr:hypothetical protein RT41_GL000388 [Lactococcus fujiensis JCM 16395]